MPKLSSHFREIINPVKGITWASAGEDVQKYLKEKHNIDSSLVIAGVSSDLFYPTRKITQIKKLGLNGVPFVNPGWDEVKRPHMLIDIAKGIGGEPVFIHSKELTEAHRMYDDIDMYICTSTNDRGPYGIAEAAFCKIPVLSTKTGFATKFNSIKTFETAEEAVKIIKNLNENPEKLQEYIEDVYKELSNELNWPSVIDKYWLPMFTQKLSLNNSK